MAGAGATQQAVLDRLRSQHGVFRSAQRLRDVTRELATDFADGTQACQVLRLLELLHQAEKSRGPRRHVLSVGRDGVTLREYRFRFFEHAAVATVTDAGENETQYYRRVLRNMAHPRTGEKLHWTRIIDYYHAAQRI